MLQAKELHLFQTDILEVLHHSDQWYYIYYYKGKVPVLFFNWAPRHRGVLGELKYSSTHYLTSALNGCEWSASRPCRFIPREKRRWYPLDRRLGGLQSRSGRGGEEKNSQTVPGLKPPIIQPVAQRYTTELSRFHTFYYTKVHCILADQLQICTRTKWDV
jgi:hypothetical protein